MLPLTACLKLTRGCLLLVALLAGCAEEQASLHENDHELPAHWPVDMADMADQIQLRLKRLEEEAEGNAVTRAELEDLIEWAPEVAADSELSEQAWNPIYETSETLRRHFAAGDLAVGAIHEDFVRLTDLLRAAHANLPQSTLEASMDEEE